MNNKSLQNLQDDISYFSGKTYCNNSNYGDEYLKWIQEVSSKNRIIHYEKDKNSKEVEKVSRPRGSVYYMNFGVNIGSELNYSHFCVVIKEFDHTAMVVPLSQKIENDPEWKSLNSMIAKVGAIHNLTEENNSYYALVNQMKTVSKIRLDYYKDEMGNEYDNLMLDRQQMDLIEEQIIRLCNNYTFEIQIVGNDYY